MGKEEDTTEVGKGRKDKVNKGGRPKEDGKPVKLTNTNPQSYKYLKELIAPLPDGVKDAIRKTPLTREKLRSINASVKTIVTGIWAAFPLVCSGEKCPYSNRCPLLEGGVPPVGSDCPIELYNLMRNIEAYSEDMGIDGANKVEFDQVVNVSLCDAMLDRVRNAMSKRPDGYSDLTPVGIDDSGNVILKRGVSVEVLIEEKYSKMKDTLLKSLLATRESRAKHGVLDDRDRGVVVAKIKKSARALIEASNTVVEVRK